MLAAIYALIGLCAAMFAANVATSIYLWRTLSRLSDERVSLAESDADLATSRANEETATRIARDATELVDAIRASNIKERKANADAKDIEIDTATPEQLIVLGNRHELPDPFAEQADTSASSDTKEVPASTTADTAKIGSKLRR